MTFTLATATLADVPLLTRLVNSAFRGEASRLGWTCEADLIEGGQRIDENEMRAMLAAPAAALLLCRTATGETLGCFHVQAKAGGVLYLTMLAVAPVGQGLGVGKFLLQAAEEFGQRHQCTVSRMSVISLRPELIAFYERRGYRSTGVTEPFPADPKFGIPRQDLRLLILEKSLSPLGVSAT